jgi:hypothetical protein
LRGDARNGRYFFWEGATPGVLQKSVKLIDSKRVEGIRFLKSAQEYENRALIFPLFSQKSEESEREAVGRLATARCMTQAASEMGPGRADFLLRSGRQRGGRELNPQEQSTQSPEEETEAVGEGGSERNMGYGSRRSD